MHARDALPLFQSIDRAFARGAAVPCRSGCTGCCYGPFDISPADAALVAAGVAALDDTSRTALRDRAATQLAAYARVLPHWPPPHDVDALTEDAFDAFCDALIALPCPALDTEGRCVLYHHRPSTCRLMGRSWTIDTGGTVLDNACPIQDQFPGYTAVPPTAIDLEHIETSLADADAAAADNGFVATTVASAIFR